MDPRTPSFGMGAPQIHPRKPAAPWADEGVRGSIESCYLTLYTLYYKVLRMIDVTEPFLRSIPKRWIPREMTTAPALDPAQSVGAVEKHYTLLINPFYPKDANASFGKHVLTPTLALTSFAATTPAHWRIDYWDENLLDGRPPFRPMPQVVGITVHLTFARRAYELADWYRARGSKVIFGGLQFFHVPMNARRMPTPLPSATACSCGRASCATSKPESSSRAMSPLTKTTTAMIRRRGGRSCRATVS